MICKNIRCHIIGLAVLATLLGSIDATARTKTLYRVQTNLLGCELSVNEIRLATADLRGASTGSVALNLWISRGYNRLTLAGTATRSRCEVKVVQTSLGPKNTEKTVLQLKLRGKKTKVQRFRARVPWGPWSWMKGARFSLNAKTKAALYKQYQRVWRALRKKDLAYLQAWFEPVNRDVSIAGYLTAKQAAEMVDWADFFNAKKYTPVPLPALKDLRLRVYGGRLAELRGADGKPPAAFRHQGAKTSFAGVYFKPKAGSWKLVRNGP